MADNPASILDSVKHVLGISSDYTDFDIDVIMHINTSFMVLNQLGVGPSDPFVITDNTKLWTDFSSDINKIQAVQTYIQLNVRLIFDPPATSFTIDAYEKVIAEMVFRLNVMGEEINPPSDPLPKKNEVPWAWPPFDNDEIVVGDVFGDAG